MNEYLLSRTWKAGWEKVVYSWGLRFKSNEYYENLKDELYTFSLRIGPTAKNSTHITFRMISSFNIDISLVDNI